MYRILESRVRQALHEFIRAKYSVDLPIVTDRPPKLSLGELASPLCFELAKRLKRAPRQIAQEISAALPPIPGVARWEVAGAGYLNAFFDRSAFFSQASELSARQLVAPPRPAADAPKFIVEHTNINPNKAAHIGHLRNAALGDTLVRLLRHTGHRVEVQNYIDNTGVQVADVVVGFLHLEKKSPAEVRVLAAIPRFDYFCWDLYARVTQWYAGDTSRAALRAETLKAIEEDHGDAAEMGRLISTAIVHCHLRTMERLGVEYDVLPAESEILHLKFWAAAFELLKQRRAIEYVASGKNAGCWVMRLPAADGAPASQPGGEDDDAGTKIIVRSNGTVTYVGKDIAYQMWKFGLLGRDFHYRRFHTHPSGHVVWATSSGRDESGAPQFGRAAHVFNVIDSRQSYLQDVVVAGLRALGFEEQARASNHFAYEIVALTPRCAQELGYPLTAEELKKPHVEVSGRKGLGVKADDLLDRLQSSARAEVDQRHPGLPGDERAAMARAIAIGALRYFLLKFTRNTTIAFDFKDALSFEGETGPYCQYSVVRIRNIFRKHAEQSGAMPPDSEKSTEDAARFLAPPGGDDLWELVLLAGSLGSSTDAALGAQEPAFLAKYAFQLAQSFNAFYHTHHILSEPDAARKAFLLSLCGLVQTQLVTALSVLGIESPERM